MLTYVRIRAIGGKQPAELRKLLKASSSLLCYKLLIKQCACTFVYVCITYVEVDVTCITDIQIIDFSTKGDSRRRSRGQVRNEEDGLKNVLVRRFPTKLRSFTAFDR